MALQDESLPVASVVANVVGEPDTSQNLVAGVRNAIGQRRPDLCLLFASAHYEDEIEALVTGLQDSLQPRSFIGCTAEAVIGGDSEYEHQPAAVLWAACMPEAGLASFHLSEEDLGRMDSVAAVREQVGVPSENDANFVLLADPFSFGRGLVPFLEMLGHAYPGRPAIGGMASAGDEAGQNVLIFDGHVLRSGLVGVALWGSVRMDTVVSQGCRPIGRHMVITKAEQNVIYQLGGRPAIIAVNEMLRECPKQDKELVHRRGLLVGRVINEYQRSFGRGDFLIRNPISIDQDTGALAVNELVRPGQTIQFHVRDGVSADEDLRTLLASPRPAQPAGALLFTCNGRGTRLFSDRNHDARAVVGAAGSPPLAGFFCAGEIGPVGGRNYLHGHTASIGFLRPSDEARDA